LRILLFSRDLRATFFNRLSGKREEMLDFPPVVRGYRQSSRIYFWQVVAADFEKPTADSKPNGITVELELAWYVWYRYMSTHLVCTRIGV